MTCQVKQKTRSTDYGIRGGLYHASGLAAHYGTRMETKQRTFFVLKRASFKEKIPIPSNHPLKSRLRTGYCVFTFDFLS